MSLATSGQAVVAAAQQRSLILPVAEDFTSTPGRGVSATISGRTVQVGSPALLRPAQMTEVTWDEATAAVKMLEARGRTAALVVVDGVPAVVDVSRQAHRLVRANLVFASTMMAALVLVDLIWILPLPLAVAGHEGSTVVASLNGLRLLRREVWDPGS